MGRRGARPVPGRGVPPLSVFVDTSALYSYFVRDDEDHGSGDRGELSLVDCVSLEFMRAKGLREALALDADFTAAGYRLLPTSGW